MGENAPRLVSDWIPPSHGLRANWRHCFTRLPNARYRTAILSLEFLLAGGDADLFRYSISDLPGDFDGDGKVDGADFLVWQQGLGTIYDATDLDDWEANYGAGTLASLNAAASTAVPEPSTGIILLLGIATLLFRRNAVVS